MWDKEKLEKLPLLESPSDIISAILDLSRECNGKMMVRLVSQESSDSEFWFNPLALQIERDEMERKVSKGTGMQAKLTAEILSHKLRIAEVVPLEIDETDSAEPFHLQVDDFAKKLDYEWSKSFTGWYKKREK